VTAGELMAIQVTAAVPAAIVTAGLAISSRGAGMAGESLPGRVFPWPPSHAEGGQCEGAQEDDYANDQQVDQAFDDHADDAQRDRRDYQKQEKGDHLILRSDATGQRRAMRRSPPAPCS
jgi:hypothetical protein